MITCFDSRICGIPCQVEVTEIGEHRPMRITGSGFGDADPPEYPDYEYRILDRRGRPALWLVAKMSQKDWELVQEEYQAARFAERNGCTY